MSGMKRIYNQSTLETQLKIPRKREKNKRNKETKPEYS